MSRTLTAADRKRLIKMASTMPVGSPERKAVLKGLSKSAKSMDRMEYFKWLDNLAVGDEIVGYWSAGSGGHYHGKARIKKVNRKSVVAELMEEVKSQVGGPPYPIGHTLRFPTDPFGRRFSEFFNAPMPLGVNRITRPEVLRFASGFQSKGLKKTKVASDSPILMPVRGGDELVMPANGTDFKLREVQKMIGGYVEVVYLRDGRIMLVDEEGLLKGLPLNRAASRMAGRPIVGNALVMPNDMFR